MKSLIKLAIFSIFVMIIFSIGCAGKPIRVGVVDQEVNSANFDLTKGQSISASASGFQLLLFIPISINSRHDRAYQKLRSDAGDAYITDIKIQESWSYAFIGTIYTTTIEAMAYPRKS
jgi:hypothetical protein